MKIRLTFFLAFLFAIPAFSQSEQLDLFEFKISLDDTGLYTVFWKPNIDMENYVIGSGQISFSAPTGSFELTDMTSHNGIWNENIDIVTSPEMAEDKDYFFIGLLDGEPHQPTKTTEEIILVTFRNAKNCTEKVELLDKEDPYIIYIDSLLNCLNCSSLGFIPNLDLAVFDINQQKVYNVRGTYDKGSATCNNLFTTETFGYTPELFSVFPNPASHFMKVLIEAPLEEDIVIKLTDMTGQLIVSSIISKGNKSTSLDVATINEGIYFVHFYATDYQKTEKVMILRN